MEFETDKRYIVKFHFPTTYVASDSLDYDELLALLIASEHGTVFTVETEYRRYNINPALVCYAEVARDTPF